MSDLRVNVPLANMEEELSDEVPLECQNNLRRILGEYNLALFIFYFYIHFEYFEFRWSRRWK